MSFSSRWWRIFGSASAVALLLCLSCSDWSQRESPDLPIAPLAQTAIAAPTSRIWVFLKAPGAPPVMLCPDALLREGALIQAAYQTNARHIAIVSVDGRGSVTVHFPESPPSTTRVQRRGRLTLLETAFELDNAPAYEHFLLFTSREPISIPSLKVWTEQTPYAALFKERPPGSARLTADFRILKALE